MLKLEFFIWGTIDELPLALDKTSRRIISTSMVSRSITPWCVHGNTANKSAASASSVLLRQKIVKRCREDIYHFLNHENGQIAIYDAVNPIAGGRRSLAREFAKNDIEVNKAMKLSRVVLIPP